MGYDRLPSLETQKNRFKEDLWKLGDNPVRLPLSPSFRSNFPRDLA